MLEQLEHIHSHVDEIALNIARRHDEMVWTLLEQAGFSRQYVKEHPSEFHRTVLGIEDTVTTYYHLNTELFTVRTKIHHSVEDAQVNVVFDIVVRPEVSRNVPT